MSHAAIFCCTWESVSLEAGELLCAERLQGQPDERGDDDEREERAAEESIH